MNVFQISVEERILDGQPRLVGKHAQRVKILFRDGVSVVQIVHQDDADDLSLTPEGNGCKSVIPGFSTEMSSYIASYL